MPRLSQRTFDRYRNALDLSHRRFDAEGKPVIEEMTRYFKGEQWKNPAGQTPGALPQVTANLVFADVKVMVPVLALRNPRVFCKPTGATTQMPVPVPPAAPGMPPAMEMQPVQIVNGRPVPVLEVARAKEALVNYRWRQLRLVRQTRRVIMDALLSPFGLMKIGYELATEKVALDDAGEATEVLEPNELITAESPYAVRWSPLDFRVDPHARYPTLEDAEWVAFGWKARLEDVKRNRRFHNTRSLEATVEVRQDWPSGSATPARRDSEQGDDDLMRVQLWEVWDKRTNMRIVLADDHDKALEYADWPQAYQGFPCETLFFTEHPDLLYGPPDLRQILGQQDAYNRINSMILNHVNKWVRKLAVTRGSLDEKESAKLEQPIDGQVLEFDGTPKDSIMAIPDAPMPVDAWQTRANFREDHDRVSGVADFVRGVAEKVDTATEAAALQSNLNVRTNDTRATVEDFAERVSQKLLHIDAQTINLPASIPIMGLEGAKAYRDWVHIQNRETLLAETDCEVEIGSMQPINEQTRKRDTLEVFTLLRNDPLTDQFKLRARLVPAYRESIPELEGILLTRDQFEDLQQRQMMQMQQVQQRMGQKPGAPAPGGPPARPVGGPPRPAAPARPMRPPAAMAGSASGPRPVPGPVDQEV